MVKNKREKNLIVKLGLLIFLLIFLCSCTKIKENSSEKKSMEYFSDKRAGVIAGTATAESIQAVFPRPIINQYPDGASELLALKLGKVDYVVCETTAYFQYKQTDPGYQLAEGKLETLAQAFPVSDYCEETLGYDLLSEFNEYVEESKKNGFIDKLIEKWFMNSTEGIDYETKVVENPKAVINVAVNMFTPYTFLQGDKLAGFDAEFLETFCEKYNYGFKYNYIDFSGLLASISSGKADIAIGAITATAERKKKIKFIDPYYYDDLVVVYYEKEASATPLGDSLRDGFNSTFVKENRYKLFIDGCIATIIITLCSIIFGILFGYSLYLLYRLDVGIVKKLISVYRYIINGTPVVVLIMIFYYIIFKNIDIPGIIVAIIAFSMVFGTYVLEALVSYIGVIDKGQYEAGIAIGYSDFQVFSKILFPQAILNILPGLKTQSVELLKGTAIVGYIAVADLTKTGDIIRSRTFDAVFPLLAITILYFVIGFAIKIIINFIKVRLDPYKRTKESILDKIKND